MGNVLLFHAQEEVAQTGANTGEQTRRFTWTRFSL